MGSSEPGNLVLAEDTERLGILLFSVGMCFTFELISSHARSLSRLLGKGRLVVGFKGSDVAGECTGFNGGTDAGEEGGQHGVVVELNQDPAEHFFGGEEMLEVGAMVLGAGIADAPTGERGDGYSVCVAPQVNAERVAIDCKVVLGRRGEGEVEGNASVRGICEERHGAHVHAKANVPQKFVGARWGMQR